MKCHHYWLDTGAETFGQYQVVAHSSTEYAEYTLREFKLVDKKVSVSCMLWFVYVTLIKRLYSIVK